jgi:D-beta-D-heptose 7-phosphate kinase/D-beta-D-heptose 1-phosphate adenosyltransferase
MNKVVSKKFFLQIKKKLKKKNKTIVMTNGCFDVLHPGHIDIFEKSKKLGHVLVVLLNTDNSIKLIKGKTRPIFKQADRAKILSSIQHIDYIIFFKSRSPDQIYKNLLPDILTKGSEYKASFIAGSDFIKKNGGKIKLIPMLKKYSTTNIIKKIKNL